MENIRRNAEEDYITTPLSVLAYISKLEKQSTFQKETIERLRVLVQQYKSFCSPATRDAEVRLNKEAE